MCFSGFCQLAVAVEKRHPSTKDYRKNILTNSLHRAIIPKHIRSAPQYRGVEQLEARRAHNPEVVGSSPASATIKSTGFRKKSGAFLTF